jgi:hypothetical protein
MGIEIAPPIGYRTCDISITSCLGMRSIEDWRPIFLLPAEALGWRAGDTGNLLHAPVCLRNSIFNFTTLPN